MAIEQAWQKKLSWTLLLLPLTALYFLIVQIRRLAYRKGWLARQQVSVPVIVVGNISAGGNGKTPVVLWLAELLQRQGFHPGVVSRGYGGKSAHYPLVVAPEITPQQCGDEPKLIANRLNIPVVVAPHRSDAVNKAAELGADIVISDDGLQHYAMPRAIELAVIDGNRRHGNGLMLPSGPLREPISRLNSVFAVICNGDEAHTDEYQMQLKPQQQWLAVDGNAAAIGHNELAGKKVLAIAGIGHPQRFFDLVSKLGISADVNPLIDHAKISASRLRQWQAQYDVIIMTEKDAVKCENLGATNCYYLPVTAHIDPKLEHNLIRELRELTRE
ncbi:tetraacyldisaccharide 4'-kinase [Neiella marina]|uniref:Tetraacyldisaccharide 4'-kinase n=1 Tax=Neiella marina TaxID=508461 RepID=A0A8J2XPK4_9GAMM|nr:tetraacyldisaccharide 4'-kinase [Neiella marina]GGA77524.1 tetraacyldisaccharide 4'-kinase [Neiella marina]